MNNLEKIRKLADEIDSYQWLTPAELRKVKDKTTAALRHIANLCEEIISRLDNTIPNTDGD